MKNLLKWVAINATLRMVFDHFRPLPLLRVWREDQQNMALKSENYYYSTLFRRWIVINILQNRHWTPRGNALMKLCLKLVELRKLNASSLIHERRFNFRTTRKLKRNSHNRGFSWRKLKPLVGERHH